jgi:protease-4
MRKPSPFVVILLFLLGTLIVVLLVVWATAFIFGERRAPLISADSVGVVRLEGMVWDARPVLERLERLAKDSKVKAIVLRIDTPGGGVGPTQEIFEAVKRWKKKKKIVASLGSMATSGGYYIACAADKIFANPGTITGSIGVVIYFANMEKLMKKLGVEGQVIKSGAFKDIGSPHRGLTQREMEMVQEVVDDVHMQFMEAVSRNREIPIEELKKIADGRIFTGRQARELGLVDELGSLSDAINEAARMVGIRGEPTVVDQPRRFSLFELFTGRSSNRSLLPLWTSSPFLAYIFHP